MKKIRSLNVNKKFLSLGAVISAGFLSINLLDSRIEDLYNGSKLELEKKLGTRINKKVVLGDYKGLRLFGLELANTKIYEREDSNSNIEAENIYIGIMPIRSFFGQKWILSIKPQKTSININQSFVKNLKSPINESNLEEEKIKYDLKFNLRRLTKFKLNDINLETKLEGKFEYNSQPRQIKGYINSRFGIAENLKLKFNSKLDQEDLSFEILSRGINLKNIGIKSFNNNVALQKGNLKSNFRYSKSSKNSYCKGGFSLNNLELKTKNLEQNIKSDTIRVVCEKNNLIAKSNKLNYNNGTLISEFNLNVPLNKSVNNINLDGNIIYSRKPKSKITSEFKLSGSMPYWFDKRGLNFGKINSSFNLTRTQLGNFNTFQRAGINGFITAKGSYKGTVMDPELNIDFKIDYPMLNSIFFRETWNGNISTDNKNLLVKAQSRSAFPSFLTLNFDSNIELSNLELTRLGGNAKKGTLKIVKNNNEYFWKAEELPLNEMEYLTNDIYDRLSGTINGSGTLSNDLSVFEGKVELEDAEFRNLDLSYAFLDFAIKDDDRLSGLDVRNLKNLTSDIIPVGGGKIKILYYSDKDKNLDIKFDNISTKWSILNAIDTFKIDDNKKEPKKEAKFLTAEAISSKGKTLQDQINLINEYKENISKLESNSGLEKYFRKFESRYTGYLKIKGKDRSDFVIDSRFKGFLDLKNNNPSQITKEYFSAYLDGGLFQGKGKLVIDQFPLKTLNIFLEDQKVLKGSFGIELDYDLDKKYFETYISSKNASFLNYGLLLEKGEIKYNQEGQGRIGLDLSLLFNDKETPITLIGDINPNRKFLLDLTLEGKSELLKFIDVIYGENINFKEGNVDLKMELGGLFIQPIINAELLIKDSDIDIFNNNLRNINGKVEIKGDEIKFTDFEDKGSFKAFGEKKGVIKIKGNIPIYDYGQENTKEKVFSFSAIDFNLISKNNDFVLDSVINIYGSLEKPTLTGSLQLDDGFINIKNSSRKNDKNKTNKNKKNNEKIVNKNNLQDRIFVQNKNVDINLKEEITISEYIKKYLRPKYLFKLNFDDFNLYTGPNFRLKTNNWLAYLETPKNLVFNKSLNDDNDDKEVDLIVRGKVDVKKGTIKYNTTPFKIVKELNSIDFGDIDEKIDGLGIKPKVKLNLSAKVPDRLLTLNLNNQDGNIIDNTESNSGSNDFGRVGIGDPRKIKVNAFYDGVITKISLDENFENYWFKRLEFRSTPNRSKAEIIALIGANEADIINRAFISQLDGANAFSERFQLSLYPAMIENNEPVNNVFSNKNEDINNSQGSDITGNSSSQAWVAEIGLDITDQINFSVQAIPDRDDLPPLGILTLQANEYLELLGSYDSDGDWKSQVQLFWRY